MTDRTKAVLKIIGGSFSLMFAIAAPFMEGDLSPKVFAVVCFGWFAFWGLGCGISEIHVENKIKAENAAYWARMGKAHPTNGPDQRPAMLPSFWYKLLEGRSGVVTVIGLIASILGIIGFYLQFLRR